MVSLFLKNGVRFSSSCTLLLLLAVATAVVPSSCGFTRPCTTGWIRRCKGSNGGGNSAPSYYCLYGNGSSCKLYWTGENSNDPENDDENILVRMTRQTTAVLTKPTPVASIPTGIVLALLTTPLFQSTWQAILTFVLFTALSILGRLATQEDTDVPADNNGEESSPSTISDGHERREHKKFFVTDVFAYGFAASSSYLILPSSLSPSASSTYSDSLDAVNVIEIAFGLGVLAATIAVLSQTEGTVFQQETTMQDSETNWDEINGINGSSGTSLEVWDEKLKQRETTRQVPRNDDS